MCDPVLSGMNAHELKQLRNHALMSQEAGSSGECTLEAAAASLLSAHLLLMRDCANLLPGTRSADADGRPVSLGRGVNVK